MIPLRVAMLVMSSIVAVCWSLAGDLSGWEESEVWTVDHLRTMASSKMATTALSRLAGGASSPDGAELEGVIDGMTSEELGTALLAEVSTDEHPANPLASLTRLVQFVTKANYSKGATCGAKGTAGAEGLEACTAQCGRTRLYHPVPSQAACYAICSMAVAPCGLRPLTWRRLSREVSEKVLDAMDVLATEAFNVYLVVSGLFMVIYLSENIWLYVDDVWVGVFIIAVFMVLICSPFNYLLSRTVYRAVRAFWCQEEEGQAAATGQLGYTITPSHPEIHRRRDLFSSGQRTRVTSPSSL